MANIAISEISTTAQNINVGDLLLVSKNNGDGTYTSAKIDASKLLASCRELDYSDNRAFQTLETNLFKKNGTSYVVNNAYLDISNLISNFGTNNRLDDFDFDSYTIPYSGLLVCRFSAFANVPLDNELNGSEIHERASTVLKVNNFAILHWDAETYKKSNELTRENGIDCSSQTVYVNQGDIVNMTVNVFTSANVMFSNLTQSWLVPYKYQ